MEHCQELRSASRACHHPSGYKGQEDCDKNHSRNASPTSRLNGGGIVSFGTGNFRAGHFGTVDFGPVYFGMGLFGDFRGFAETPLQNGTRQMQQFSRT
jgi:hypothetical protein